MSTSILLFTLMKERAGESETAKRRFGAPAMFRCCMRSTVYERTNAPVSMCKILKDFGSVGLGIRPRLRLAGFPGVQIFVSRQINFRNGKTIRNRMHARKSCVSSCEIQKRRRTRRKLTSTPKKFGGFASPAVELFFKDVPCPRDVAVLGNIQWTAGRDERSDVQAITSSFRPENERDATPHDVFNCPNNSSVHSYRQHGRSDRGADATACPVGGGNGVIGARYRVLPATRRGDGSCPGCTCRPGDPENFKLVRGGRGSVGAARQAAGETGEGERPSWRGCLCDSWRAAGVCKCTYPMRFW